METNIKIGITILNDKKKLLKKDEKKGDEWTLYQ